MIRRSLSCEQHFPFLLHVCCCRTYFNFSVHVCHVYVLCLFFECMQHAVWSGVALASSQLCVHVHSLTNVCLGSRLNDCYALLYFILVNFCLGNASHSPPLPLEVGLFIATRGLGKSVEAPQRGLGRVPPANLFSSICSPRKPHLLTPSFVLFYSF